MKFRKKPVVINAIEWTGENLKEIIDFTGLHESAKKWTWEEYEAVVKEKGLKIFTLEGTHMATIGDMIIKGVHGEFYPCKPDIFAKTYDRVFEPGICPPPTRRETIEAMINGTTERLTNICPKCLSNEKLKGYPDPECTVCKGTGRET